MSQIEANPRAVIGGNFPPEDERAPPKSQRIVTPEDAQVFRLIVRMLAARCEVAKWRVTEKRKGGEYGRTVRCIAIGYMRGVGFPVWKLEMMWDLNRKQVGQEELAFLTMRGVNEVVDRNVERIETMLDAALQIELEPLMTEAALEIEEVILTRHAAKQERTEAKKAKASAPPPPKTKKKLTEAERLVQRNEARRQLAVIQRDIDIAMSVIRKAAEDGSSRDDKRNAAAEAKKLNALVKSRDKLQPLAAKKTA